MIVCVFLSDDQLFGRGGRERPTDDHNNDVARTQLADDRGLVELELADVTRLAHVLVIIQHIQLQYPRAAHVSTTTTTTTTAATNE